MAKDRQTRKASSASTLVVGLALIAFAFFSRHGGVPNGGILFAGLICTGLSGFAIAKSLGVTFFQSRRLPKKEVMRLAEARKGLLTLSEITTALDIDPDLARRTLTALSKDGIANQRWQEVRKNLWEFPDYMKLPISESIELAKAKGGRLTISDLVSAGHTKDTARQTLDTLNEKGLAQQDPTPSAPGSESAMIVTTQ